MRIVQSGTQNDVSRFAGVLILTGDAGTDEIFWLCGDSLVYHRKLLGGLND